MEEFQLFAFQNLLKQGNTRRFQLLILDNVDCYSNEKTIEIVKTKSIDQLNYLIHVQRF